MNRRTLLGGLGTATTIGLAGCLTASGKVRPPQPDEQQLDDGGWEQVDQSQAEYFQQEYGPVTVTATAVSRIWEDRALQRELREKTMGQIDTAVSTFFATRITVDPSFQDIPDFGKERIEEEVETRADEQFQTRLEEFAENVQSEALAEDLEIETGESASVRRYTAAFPVPDFQYPIAEDTEVEVQNEPLEIEGHLATWVHDGAVYVAGGAYPNENYTKELSEDLTDAITVSVDVDLGLEPERYSEELLTLVRTTE